MRGHMFDDKAISHINIRHNFKLFYEKATFQSNAPFRMEISENST